MKLTRSCAKRGSLFVAAFVVAAGPVRAGVLSMVSGSEQLTAVSAKVFNGYARATNPDGSYRTETFAFGNGGMVSALYTGTDTAAVYAHGFPAEGGVVNDPTIDDVSFRVLSRTIARPLEEQRYMPTQDPKETRLLIMVYWGRSGGSYLETDGYLKDNIDAWNAQLMGFDSERVFQERNDASTVFFGRSIRSSIMDNIHSDLVSAISMDRYYVVLRAFDFQTAWRQRKIKLLWETRFSISERQHDFAVELPTMAHTASRYFGKDTKGLIRARIPEGQIEIGEVKSLGNVPGN